MLEFLDIVKSLLFLINSVTSLSTVNIFVPVIVSV